MPTVGRKGNRDEVTISFGDLEGMESVEKTALFQVATHRILNCQSDISKPRL